MKRRIRYYRLIWIKHDLPAGLSVFFVALPLCMGIALASGAPLYAGILSGMIGGLIVSLISGSQLGVSGPAAGLTTVVAASIIAQGDYSIFLLSVMIAGLFQLLLGILKLGAVANYFPSAVIKGMLAAIGIILISKQVPLALGYEQPNFWTSVFLSISKPHDLKDNLGSFYQHYSGATMLISLLSVIILILFQQPFAKKYKVLQAPFLVVLLGMGFSILLRHFNIGVQLKQTQLVQIPANIFSNILFPDFTKIFSNQLVWKDGLLIGLLATLETLLCVEAVDKLDARNRITPVNRELIAQGIGNMLCGLLGAIPITAVVVRGAANVDAGARTKLSAFTHGLFLLLAVIFIPFLLNLIPYASLASILLITGYNLTKPRLYVHMFGLGRKQFIPFLITIFVILSTDLLMGVSIGLLISVYYIIQNNFRTEYVISTIKKHETVYFTIKLNSNVSFLNKVKLRKALDQIPEYSVLTIDGSESHFIDYDILEIISEYASKAHDRHIELHIPGIQKVNITAIH